MYPMLSEQALNQFDHLVKYSPVNSYFEYRLQVYISNYFDFYTKKKIVQEKQNIVELLLKVLEEHEQHLVDLHYV